MPKSKKRTQEKLPTQTLDIDKIEAGLPKKKSRSHHIVVKVDKLHKKFSNGKLTTHILKDISFNLYSGEFVIISGPSGSGKSTLLHSILGLEEPTAGKVFIRNTDIYNDLNEHDRTLYRREKIGMVFQQSNWIKSLNVLENVSYPLWLSGFTESAAKKRALEILEKVELANWAYNNPNELSGGQQQRVSLARALSSDPGIIIADEPTGNLDTQSSADIMSLLALLNREERRMIVMVTHDLQLMPIASRRIVLMDGAIVYDQHD
ncbi:ABC transporter ATP-binding protein [Candidatus Woesebacteria bacterium]|nr:ABC transporter ATP-binding protein [Candidatus Woesebacteria bacterium]